MEFSVSREQLLEKAQTAASVVERKQTMAILANVLIEVDATGSVVTGTDLDTEISTSMELVEVASGGAVTVPLRSWSISQKLCQKDRSCNSSRMVLRFLYRPGDLGSNWRRCQPRIIREWKYGVT